MAPGVRKSESLGPFERRVAAMTAQATEDAAMPRLVRIEFAYTYAVDGLERAGTVTCSVGNDALDRKSPPSLDSRIPR